MDLNTASMTDIAQAVRSKKTSAVEVTKHFISRVDKLDKAINSFVTMNSKALEEAAQVDQAIAAGRDVGSLAGVPIAVKDLLCTEGLRTTACSKILENYIPPYSASVVTRLQKAGAVVLGKTSLG